MSDVSYLVMKSYFQSALIPSLMNVQHSRGKACRYSVSESKEECIRSEWCSRGKNLTTIIASILDQTLVESKLYITQVPNEDALRKFEATFKEKNIDHKIWVEQPENIPTCIALKPYPKQYVKGLVKNLKLMKD
ncbi:putative peptidyl-tRNA hydrolase PTRHD1 isoform X3 [Bemisia tabaci]|uniref:putative peptidyl-tRNA hydrolase PTRHD1 isoform X3 n=1 Tax=Bemisia tabaci TaxID=7038 RepID=UPI003B283EF2